jgi:hypothetical protein
MLLLVSTGDDLDIHGDPETIWRPWLAGELRSRPIHSGHREAAPHPTEDNGSQAGLPNLTVADKGGSAGLRRPGTRPREAGFAAARNGATCKGRDPRGEGW